MVWHNVFRVFLGFVLMFLVNSTFIDLFNERAKNKFLILENQSLREQNRNLKALLDKLGDR